MARQNWGSPRGTRKEAVKKNVLLKKMANLMDTLFPSKDTLGLKLHSFFFIKLMS